MRACFFSRFEHQKRPLLSHIVLFNFHSLEAFKACLEACPEVFCSNFNGLTTLEVRLAWRPASNFVSSYKLFVLLQFLEP